MTVQWLIQWWNLIFVLPAMLALLYMGLCVVTGIGTHDGDADISADADADTDMDADADVDADADMDADADADVSADADTDADADADADSDHDADASHESSSSASTAILSWLGAGKAPLSLLAGVLLLTWGIVGFGANVILRPPESPGWKQAAAPFVSLPLAAVCALLATSGFSRILAKIIPLRGTSAHRRHELLGLVGEAILPISTEFGMAAVRDASGEPYQVACRVDASAPPIEKGTRVRLIGYNARQRMFLVAPEPRPKQ